MPATLAPKSGGPHEQQAAGPASPTSSTTLAVVYDLRPPATDASRYGQACTGGAMNILSNFTHTCPVRIKRGKLAANLQRPPYTAVGKAFVADDDFEMYSMMLIRSIQQKSKGAHHA